MRPSDSNCHTAAHCAESICVSPFMSVATDSILIQQQPESLSASVVLWGRPPWFQVCVAGRLGPPAACLTPAVAMSLLVSCHHKAKPVPHMLQFAKRKGVCIRMAQHLIRDEDSVATSRGGVNRGDWQERNANAQPQASSAGSSKARGGREKGTGQQVG